MKRHTLALLKIKGVLSMENAVIYARYSSVGQNEQSIEGQVRICKEFAESKGFSIVKIYNDKARTGTNDNRPDFQKMITDAESGAFQHILVYKFDRFARNRIDSIMYKARLKKDFGIRVISATEPVSDDEGGEIYEMFLEWNDEKYSQRLAKRIKDGIVTAMKNGTYTGGSKVLYGYKLIDTDKVGKKGTIHKVVIDEEQAEAVKLAFEEFANGTSKKDIIELLNKKGMKYYGRQWKVSTFETMFKNEKYTGEYERLGQKWNNIFPQIINRVIFEKVQKRLESNKHFSGANSAIEPYFLTGKVFCGYCDSMVIAGGGTSHTGKKYYYYECKGKKRKICTKKNEDKNDLELRVTRHVKKFLSDPENARIAAEDTIRHYEQRTGDDGMKSVDTKIQRANEEIEQATNSYMAVRNDLLRLNIEKKMDELEIYLNDLLTEKARLELERGLRVTKEKILGFIADLMRETLRIKNISKK